MSKATDMLERWKTFVRDVLSGYSYPPLLIAFVLDILAGVAAATLAIVGYYWIWIKL